MLNLRPYQERSVDGIRDVYSRGARSPLLVLPTGAGKTVVFSYIAGSTSSRGKRVLILVHRIELLRQTSNKLMEAGVLHGLISPKYTPNLHAPVQVASVQTVVNRLEKIYEPDLIIIDEAHHALANTWKRILNRFPKARVLGVTATPVRGDGTGLGVQAGGVFDSLIVGMQVQELIDLGFLVKPIVFAPTERIDLSGVRIVRGDYDNKQIEGLVDKPTITGDAVKHYMRICPGTPAVVFCISVNHAQHVAEEFRRAGFRAYHADGSLDDDVRARILGGLGNGTVDVVTSCDLISEGTDIPAIGCAILLRPTNSQGLFLQQVGRALRPCEGKDRAIVLDHVGNVITHGMPEEYRDWSLDGDERKKKRKGDEPAIRVSQCMNCFAVHTPAPVCPECGHVYEVKKSDLPEYVEGDLREITDAQREAIRKSQVREVGKARSLEDLERIEAERGYKKGWAKHVYNSREKKKEPINQ